MGAAHLGYDAVSKGNGKGGCVVADRKGIGTDDGAGDGGQVVLEEGLGRCAAEAAAARKQAERAKQAAAQVRTMATRSLPCRCPCSRRRCLSEQPP